MVMDARFTEFPESVSGFNFNDETALPSFDPSVNLTRGFQYRDDSIDLSFLVPPSTPPDPYHGYFAPSSGMSSEVDSPDDSEFSDTVLKYLNQILMEEKMEDKPSMFPDPLALQAAEKSFYEVLGEKYPPSPYRPQVYVDQNAESPEDNFFGSSSEYSTNSSTSTGNSNDPQFVGDSPEQKPSLLQYHPLEYYPPSTLQSSLLWSSDTINSFGNNTTGAVDSSASTNIVSNIFSDSESILQFKKGMEEASKFLPTSTPLVIDLDKFNLPSESKESAPDVVVKLEKDERGNSPNGSRGKKHYHGDDSFFEEERISKQSAIYTEEAELSEMFDRVLLCTEVKVEPVCYDEESPSHVGKSVQQNGQTLTSDVEKTRAKKQIKSEAVDLRTLLISCAQSVAADDRRTANEQLKQIRQHSSPSGDASQRLAHIFANGLEARLAGTGSQIYAGLARKQISAAEKLKAYEVFLSACPFKKLTYFFANKMIWDASVNASKLHIIDFGIQYGFQWPILIQYLMKRPIGPPKLRITGIELPQPGFRPAERVMETGRRLAGYCERFGVPFEYNAIATQKWEAINIEDLKIESDEFVAVNCMFRFKNLLDETVDLNSPRDGVLKLIRKMNPDLFVHSVINGSHSAPFFVTRFREALFHYSAWFDMFDSTLSREDPQRMNFEKEFYGREAMNVIACEGPERVERPETYKQSQVRNMRAGFRLLPLDQELLKMLKGKTKGGCHHKDFVFDQDSNWMIQGWKGRILHATSCWVPTQY